MSETMYDCYISQFDCLKRILAGKDALMDGFADYYGSVGPNRVYLVGSGTSFNACAAAAAFMEEALRVEVTAMAPTCMGKTYGKRPLVVAVSQSGRSTNTVGVIESIGKSGVPVATLTDPKDTPVGNSGNFAVHLAAGNEQIGPKTRGYMATVLTLYLMSMEAGLAGGTMDRARYNKHLADFEDAAARGGEYLDTCRAFYDAHFNELKKATNYLFVGKGVAAKVAQEDALKVLETLCYPSIGYEYEEFLHGPACCTDGNLALFLFLARDSDRDRMLRTAEIIREATPNCYIVSHDASIKGDNVLYLETADSAFLSPFTDILFGQLVSAKLPEALGRQRHPAVKDIFSRMGTKLPQEA